MKSSKAAPKPQACPPKPSLTNRPLMTFYQAESLMKLFEVLANDTRLRLLHALAKDNEMCVTSIADTLGMKPQAISNQLQRMTDRGILASRRNGNHIYYHIADPCVIGLLDQGFCLMEDAEGRKP